MGTPTIAEIVSVTTEYARRRYWMAPAREAAMWYQGGRDVRWLRWPAAYWWHQYDAGARAALKYRTGGD